MPNHVAVEVIFRDVDAAAQDRIIAATCNAKGEVDFEILLPIPLNCWMGGVSAKHSETFPDTALDWCRKNWSTKWGAYQQDSPVTRTDDTLTLRFTTAWNAPYGWLVAVYNKLKMAFEYNYLSEGATRGKSGRFLADVSHFDAWIETECDDEMQKHLHLLRWGCESFPDEDEEEAVPVN